MSKMAVESQRTDELQAEYQSKVNQMEEQVHRRNSEILNLCKEREGLSHKLTETMNQLSSR